MSITEQIILHLQQMPEPLQAEVLDFIEHLDLKPGLSTASREDRDWAQISLATALRGMEDEAPLYSVSDIRDRP